MFLELDQEEEDRRQQELESARAVEDVNLDESFETEDPSEVRFLKILKTILDIIWINYPLDIR